MPTKAAHYRGSRSFTVDEVEVPPPGPGEVQIAVAYCGICGTDLHIYLGHMDGRVGFGRVIGHEMSGVIAAVGPDVEGLVYGDRVVVRPLDHCGECPACKAGYEHICHNLKFIGIDTDGAFQERWNVPAHTIHLVPDAVPLAHAALIEPMAVAVHDVSRGRVKPGETVLVIGAGPIGMLVAMVARHVGADVMISEINELRLAFAECAGFRTFNPAEGDVAAAVHAATDGKGADVVFEISGSPAGVALMTAAAATRGRIVMVAIHSSRPEIDLFQFFWREIEMIGARVYVPEDYESAIKLLAEGVVDAESFITDIRGLDQIESAFQLLAKAPNSMKSMIRISEEPA